MEFSSVLTSWDVYHPDGRRQLEDDTAALSTVFLPAGAQFDVAILQTGSTQPLHVQPMSVSQPRSVFSRVEARGSLRQFKFTKPGDDVGTYRVSRKPITVVPFSIEFQKKDDLFAPKMHVYANGPWNQFADLFASLKTGAEANHVMVMRGEIETGSTPSTRKYDRTKSQFPSVPNRMPVKYGMARSSC